MIGPLENYKNYHQNQINVIIHQICIPFLLMSFYACTPYYLSLSVNIFYCLNFLLFDLFSKKSKGSLIYMNSIYLGHIFLKVNLSKLVNVSIHILGWVFQIIGHRFFEKNTPALIDNLYDSLLFAPYFTYLETCHSFKIEDRPKYIIKKKIDESQKKKTIIYFSGLFQNCSKQFSYLNSESPNFNHIYVETYFKKGDVYQDTLMNIIDELEDLQLECIVGFSFGGSLAIQLKNLLIQKKNISVPTILISPGGFSSNGFIENIISYISKIFLKLYSNDKWYMVSNYPNYQNDYCLEKNDYVVCSTTDSIHSYQSHKEHSQVLLAKNVSHLKMIPFIDKNRLLQQLINFDYDIKKVKYRNKNSKLNQFIFGGHFFPWHLCLWSLTSCFYQYTYFKNNYDYLNLFYGFLSTSCIWSFTEYIFHRFLLHHVLINEHLKHHKFPNKLSIIHTPMFFVIINWFIYQYIFKNIFSPPMLVSYYIFFPIFYLSFEITHLLTHSYQGKNKIILGAKTYHKLHHINDKVNYSFVTSFWDYIFGTLSPKYHVSWIELIFGFVPFYSFLVRLNDNKSI